MILQYEKSQGVTSYCPTSMTLPKEELLAIFQTAADVEQDDTCAHIVGINMEGPFLGSCEKRRSCGRIYPQTGCRIFPANAIRQPMA